MVGVVRRVHAVLQVTRITTLLLLFFSSGLVPRLTFPISFVAIVDELTYYLQSMSDFELGKYSIAIAIDVS